MFECMVSGIPREGIAYLQSIPLDRRRERGQVYTPSYLVDFVIDLALRDDSLEGPVLDPACGGGAFLRGLVRRLAKDFVRRGIRIQDEPGRSRFLDAVADTVYGVDVDADGVAVARDVVRAAVLDRSPGGLPADFLARNLCVADFLFEPVDRELGVADGFQLVVGNPPYVPTTRITTAYKRRARADYRAARGRIDLYMLFMERATTMLTHGGRLAFITPDKYLQSQSAESLRSLLRERGALQAIALFSSHRVFEGAATVPCVTVWERGGSQRVVAVTECDHDEKSGRVQTTRKRDLPTRSLQPSGWRVAREEVEDLSKLISGRHPPLRSFALRVSAGIATGLNKAFLIPSTDSHGVEPALRRPALRGRDIQAFELFESGLELLVPYAYETDGRPQLVDLRDYPGAYAWLDQWREPLENRHCVRTWGKAWYDLHDPIPFDLARLEKIVVPDVARSNRFAYDNGSALPLHSAYYLLPVGVDPVVLTAILNSPPIEFLLRARAPRVKDGFSRYRRQFLLDLPIPAVSDGQAADIRSMVERGETDALADVTTGLFGLPPELIRTALSELEQEPSEPAREARAS